MRWKKFSEELPPEGKYILTYNKKHHRYKVDYIILCRNEDMSVPFIWGHRDLPLFDPIVTTEMDNVTHWMELPEPPVEFDKEYINGICCLSVKDSTD